MATTKRIGVGIAVLLGLVASMPIVSSAGAAPTTDTTATSITFTEGFCSDAGAHCKQVGKGGQRFGTRLVFTIPLTVDGSEIGYEQGECVNLHRASGSNFCAYDIHLTDGFISVQGTLPYTRDGAGTIPVTGGAGAYLGAYGTLTSIGGTFDYTLEVVTPT